MDKQEIENNPKIPSDVDMSSEKEQIPSEKKQMSFDDIDTVQDSIDDVCSIEST